MKRLLGYLQTCRWLLPSVIFILSACEGYESSIPDTEVNVFRNINTYGLASYGSYLYIDAPEKAVDRIGYGGILIVHSFNTLNGYDGFCAFDLSCPVEHSWDIRVSKPDENLICKCDSCKEEYNLYFGEGTPTKGISKKPLRSYHVYIDGYNNIQVSR